MSVKALLRYAATMRAIDILRSYKSDSERISDRIRRLDHRFCNNSLILTIRDRDRGLLFSQHYLAGDLTITIFAC